MEEEDGVGEQEDREQWLNAKTKEKGRDERCAGRKNENEI